MRSSFPLALLAGALLQSCDAPSQAELIFLDGRAVAPAGDSVLAISRPTLPGVLIFNRLTRKTDTLGIDELVSPTHLQWHDGRLYVSDVRDGRAWIVVFGAGGEVEQRIDVDSITAVQHQFAVLPDGRIVLETRDDRLVAFREDSISTFALIESSPRTGLLVADQGGVLHLVPHRKVTLYNEMGKIRWRVDWQWADNVFITDISVDSRGRPNILAGREGFEGFMVYGFSPFTGEVVRWQEGPNATFSVGAYGDIEPDDSSPWLTPAAGN
jgi:hypothetical protein